MGRTFALPSNIHSVLASKLFTTLTDMALITYCSIDAVISFCRGLCISPYPSLSVFYLPSTVKYTVVLLYLQMISALICQVSSFFPRHL